MRITDEQKFRNFIITFISIILLIALAILAINQLNEEHELDHTVPYTIQSGNTLWEIGTEYRPKNMSIQEYLYNLEQYNGITANIRAGQTIQILVYKED